MMEGIIDFLEEIPTFISVYFDLYFNKSKIQSAFEMRYIVYTYIHICQTLYKIAQVARSDFYPNPVHDENFSTFRRPSI